MQSCSCIFSAVGRASSIFEKSNFLFIGCYLFRPVLGFFPITLAASQAHRCAHSRSSSHLPQSRSLEPPPPANCQWAAKAREYGSRSRQRSQWYRQCTCSSRRFSTGRKGGFALLRGSYISNIFSILAKFFYFHFRIFHSCSLSGWTNLKSSSNFKKITVDKVLFHEISLPLYRIEETLFQDILEKKEALCLSRSRERRKFKTIQREKRNWFLTL